MVLIGEYDHNAFSVLVNRHSERFYSLSYRTLFNKSDAEDIVQESFLKLWHKPDLWKANKKIKFDKEHQAKMDAEVGYRGAIEKYMYNFWDTSFEDHEWKGEDLAFCKLAQDAGINIYANLDSWTTHHGSWGFRGTFGDSLKKKEDK